MADVDFRVKFPFYSSTVSDPVDVNVDDPTFDVVNTLNITEDLPAGFYVIRISYEWSMPDTNNSALFRVISPITTGTQYRKEPKDNNDLVVETIEYGFNWTGGALTIQLEASTTDGANTLTVVSSQVTFERKT